MEMCAGSGDAPSIQKDLEQNPGLKNKFREAVK